MCQCHAFTSHGVGGFFNSQWQVLGYHLDGLQFVHVAHDPGTLGDVAFDGVGECVHACGGGQSLGQGVHEFGVNNGHGWDVVGVIAHHLGLTLFVDDDVVDGHLGACAGCGGQRDDGDRLVFGGCAALKAHHIGKLRVVGHDADAFGGVHAGATTDGDNAVGTALLECLHTLLHVGHGGVRLDFAVNLVGETCCIQHVGHHFGGAHLDESLVATYQRFRQIHAVQHFWQLLAGASTEVGHFVQNKSLCHKKRFFRLVNGILKLEKFSRCKFTYFWMRSEM